MESGQYAIECGRCGEVGVGVLTAEEARAVSDCTGPAYRQCGRCGKMTGWIAAGGQDASAGEARQTSIRTTGRADENFVPRGQERMATQTERDEVDAMLRRPDAVSCENSLAPGPVSRMPPRGGHTL